MIVHLALIQGSSPNPVVRLVFINETEYLQYLSPHHAFVGITWGEESFVFDQQSRYTGPVVRRRPLTSNDHLITVEPRKKLTSVEYDLTKAYSLPNLPARVRYEAFNPIHGFEHGLELLQSNWVELP